VGLNATNSSGVVPGGNAPKSDNVTVEMLVGTFVESLGRDVKEGEVVTITSKDARFLLPYKYAKQVTEEVEVEDEVETKTAPETKGKKKDK
jgi:hypothetical protein